MNTIEILRRLSADQLHRLAAQLNVPHGKGVRIDRLIDSVAAAITPAYVVRVLDKLAPRETACLEMIASLYDVYPSGMTVKEAAAKINLLLGAKGQGERLLQLFQQYGLALRVRHYYQEAVVVPDAVWSVVVKRLAERTARTIEQASGPRPSAQTTENYGLAVYHDLLTLLAAFAHDNVDVSQKGHVYKRTMNKLLPKLRSAEERFPPLYGEDMPRHFHFLERFLERNSLVELETIAQVQLDSLEAFLSTSYVEWARVLMQHYYNSLHLRQYHLPVSLFHSVLYRLGRNGWTDGQAVVDELSRLLHSWGLALDGKLFDMLCWSPFLAFGLMQHGRDDAGRKVWRWNPLGLEYAKRNMANPLPEDTQYEQTLGEDIFVQPNLEIFVPDNVLPGIRWMVEAVAELKTSDSVLVYEISRPRIMQALEAGWSLNDIKSLFGRYSKNPVAPNVYQTIEGWIGHFGKAQLWDVMVLHTEDAAVAEWIRNDKKLARLIVASFSPQSFVIKRTDERQVRELMSRLGVQLPVRVVHADAGAKAAQPSPYPYFGGTKPLDPEAVRLHHLQAFAPDLFMHTLDKKRVALGRLISEYEHADGDAALDEDYDDYDDNDYDDDETDGNPYLF